MVLSISPKKKAAIKKGWYKFSRNKLSVIGLVIALFVIFSAIFSPYIAPYPEHAGLFLDFSAALQAPNLTHLCGTDMMGRDILSRIFFGFRYSLAMAAVILVIAVPSGSSLGLLAGYLKGTSTDVILMRLTDIFLALPPLILAMAVCAVLEPSVFNAMLAISLTWWPWYCRLTYGTASSLRNEFFVQAAEVTGASTFHIVFREILPNCLGAILTRASLDIGVVILLGASLSFVGLGAQPPTPDLGTMVAEGSKYLPEYWWITMSPAIAIVVVVIGFNLLGDGIRDLFATEEI